MVTARADSGRTEGPGAAVSSRGPRARCRLLPEPRLLTAGSSRRQSWACPAVSLSPLQPPAGRGLPSCSGFWPDSWIGQGSSWLHALVSKHSSSKYQTGGLLNKTCDFCFLLEGRRFLPCHSRLPTSGHVHIFESALDSHHYPFNVFLVHLTAVRLNSLSMIPKSPQALLNPISERHAPQSSATIYSVSLTRIL